MSRQDANAAFALTSFLYGGNATYIEDLYARYEARPGLGRCRVARFLRQPEGPERRRRQERARRLVAEAADHRARRDARRRSTASGPKPRRRSATRCSGKAQARRRRTLRRRRAAGDARFDPRADADPRLPHPRPLPRQARSARPRAQARTTRSLIRAPTASPKPTWTARSSSTRCSASSSAPCARSSRSSSAPTARRWASSSCTSPMPRRRRGFRSASKARDKEITFTREGKRAILNKLVEAEGFEKFCDIKFTGTKRFGLDGGESLIPALEQIIKRGGNLGVKEIVLGMPHRGRLNVLTQVMGKPHRALFHEFKGGSADAGRRRRLRRREVSPRRLVGPRVRRQQGASVADREPVASRNRRSGRARQGARPAGPARRAAGQTAPW